MQSPLSPNVDRLRAALRALRQTHEHDPQNPNKLALGIKCLTVVIAQLAEEGVPKEDLQPLIDLETELKQRGVRAQVSGGSNRRKGGAPSETLLARMAALIDLLVKAGHDEGEAAQVAMRRLLAAGVAAPRAGGDARGWKRLLEWRADLMHGLASAEANDEYKEFSRTIEMIPAHERVQRVLDEHLWDRRRRPRGPEDARSEHGDGPSHSRRH